MTVVHGTKFDDMEIKLKKNTLKLLILGALIIVGLLVLINSSFWGGLISTPQLQSGNLVAVFFTGLLTGGLTCLAVQGGLLAATISQREEKKLNEKASLSGNALPILSFLVAKLAAYTILGLLLGALGSLVQLSLNATIIMQIVVIVFMLGTAFNILNVHPLFRYFVIQPPRFLSKLVRKQSKSADIFAPALLGSFTVVIPCGTTQAMMALAVASGDPLIGAAILFAFVLGTSPIFFSLGYYATKLGETFQNRFMKIAAYSLILLAMFNIQNVLSLSGNNISLPQLGFSLTSSTDASNDMDSSFVRSGPVRSATIEFTQTAYIPDQITVKTGSKVTLNLVNKIGRGCVQAFTIPKLGIQKVVPLGSSDTITFTAPSEPGTLAFMCSMGMYQGTINVI